MFKAFDSNLEFVIAQHGNVKPYLDFADHSSSQFVDLSILDTDGNGMNIEFYDNNQIEVFMTRLVIVSCTVPGNMVQDCKVMIADFENPNRVMVIKLIEL